MQAARTVAVMFIGWAVGAPVAGYISDLTGRRVLILVLGALFSLICISMVLYHTNLSFLSLNVLLFFYGVFSGTEIIVFAMARETINLTLSGTAFAFTNFIVTLGGVIFQPLVGALLDTFGDAGIIGGEHIYTVVDYQVALSVLPLSLMLVMILTFFVKDGAAREDKARQKAYD